MKRCALTDHFSEIVLLSILGGGVLIILGVAATKGEAFKSPGSARRA